MIKKVVFDIDGVLTDGRIYINEEGREIKAFNITEIDALNGIKGLGYSIMAITGENTPIIHAFKNKVEWDAFYSGIKDKMNILKKIEKEYKIGSETICYIGDGKYDIPCIQYAGLGVCPSNAIQEVKDIADVVLRGAGGESCIYELYQLLKKMKEQEESHE